MRPLAMLLVAVALTAGGCGSDDGNGAEQEKRAPHQAANEPPDVFANRLATLLATSRTKADCTDLEQINGRSIARFPCPAPPGLRRSMDRFELRRAAAYGTGAVIDYSSGDLPKGGSMLLFVGVDRAWAVARTGLVAGKTVGTGDDDSRKGYDTAVEEFLAAVRERDCDAYYRATFNGSKSKATVCKEDFPSTARLARRLATDPAAKPAYEGGNSVFGFYTLETAKPLPERVTLTLAEGDERSERPFVVMNVTPTATRGEQLAVRREYERQKRKAPAAGSMAPDPSSGKKAD